VDEAVRRVLRVKFGLGLFEHPYAEGAKRARWFSGESRLGATAAERSFVLLKNGIPWRSTGLAALGTRKTIALIAACRDPKHAGLRSGQGGQQTSSLCGLRSRKNLDGTFVTQEDRDHRRSAEQIAEAVKAAEQSDS